MELRFIGCSHMHYIQALRVGEVAMVPNISHGKPALKFKKVGDVYASEDIKRVHPIIKLLPEEEVSISESRGSGEGQSALESDSSSSGFSSFDVKEEIDDQIDDASLDGMTIGQMRDIFSSKKRKRQSHLNDNERNGVILTIKKEEEDEDELLEPLILWKKKFKDGSNMGCVKKNSKTPNNAGVAPSVQIPYTETASWSPSNYNLSIVVKIEDEPYLYPSSELCTIGDSDVLCMDEMVPGYTEEIEQAADCQSNRNPNIMYTSQEMASAVVPNEAHGEAIASNLDSEIYKFKEAEICVVNEAMHETMGHDEFWGDNDAGFSDADHVVNKEARARSLLVHGDPIEATQTDLPVDTLKSCDEDSLTGNIPMHIEASDSSSGMISSATLQPQEEVSRDSIIQYAENIREILHLNHETFAVSASQVESSSSKLDQDVQNIEVQFEDNGSSTTLFASHEMSLMGVCSGRSSSGEHLPDIPVFQDGEVGCEDGSKDDIHSGHEISDACGLSGRSPSQELQLEEQDIQTTESLTMHTNRERWLSRHQTSDTSIFIETDFLNEPNEQDRDYEPQFEDSSGENLQSSHKACATGSPVSSSDSAEKPVIFASSGFCSFPCNPAVDILDGLSHVKVCQDAEINNPADEPCSTIDATTSIELGNDDHDQRLQRSSGRLFCTRKVISPKSQERLRKLLGSVELCDDKNYPWRKLIFPKLMEVENSGVPSNKAKRVELPTSPKQCYRKQKNHMRGVPPRDIYKSPPFSVATPSVNSVQGSAESVIAFSQRQMQDIDCLASKLMNEINVMKDIIEENICYWNNSAGAKTHTPDEMKEAIENASKAQETARKWLMMMARDCNRFCKIMRLTDGSPISEKGMTRDRKKIVFADEAGGKLCHVKYIEDTSSPSEANVQDEEAE